MRVKDSCSSRIPIINFDFLPIYLQICGSAGADSEASGQRIVDIIDINGNFNGIFLILLEKAEYL